MWLKLIGIVDQGGFVVLFLKKTVDFCHKRLVFYELSFKRALLIVTLEKQR
jgi:hypothetical protein